MEIKKLDCPSCGAKFNLSNDHCEFCNTPLIVFEKEGAALPINLSEEQLINSISLNETDFWQSTKSAIQAPYSPHKKLASWSIEDLKNSAWLDSGFEGINASANASECLTIIYNSYFIIPNENFISCEELNDIGNWAVVTNYRLFLFFGTQTIVIPFDSFISWDTHGKNIVGRDGDTYDGQPILKYYVAGTKKEIKFDPCDFGIRPDVIQSITNVKEWEDLNPLQRNLLSLSRYNISKSLKINIPEYQLMAVTRINKKEKSGPCFIATATMGDFNDPVVIDLRNFRDEWILKKSWGKDFVVWYYHYGEIAARKIDKNLFLKKTSYFFIIKPLHFISQLLTK